LTADASRYIRLTSKFKDVVCDKLKMGNCLTCCVGPKVERPHTGISQPFDGTYRGQPIQGSTFGGAGGGFISAGPGARLPAPVDVPIEQPQHVEQLSDVASESDPNLSDSGAESIQSFSGSNMESVASNTTGQIVNAQGDTGAESIHSSSGSNMESVASNATGQKHAKGGKPGIFKRFLAEEPSLAAHKALSRNLHDNAGTKEGDPEAARKLGIPLKPLPEQAIRPAGKDVPVPRPRVPRSASSATSRQSNGSMQRSPTSTTGGSSRSPPLTRLTPQTTNDHGYFGSGLGNVSEDEKKRSVKERVVGFFRG
jgi:hypothetical protein